MWKTFPTLITYLSLFKTIRGIICKYQIQNEKKYY